jgi:hypothetical protein
MVHPKKPPRLVVVAALLAAGAGTAGVLLMRSRPITTRHATTQTASASRSGASAPGTDQAGRKPPVFVAATVTPRDGTESFPQVTTRPASQQPGLDTLKERWAHNPEFTTFAARAHLSEEQKAHVLDQLAFADYQAASLRSTIADPERLVRQLLAHVRAVASMKLSDQQRALFFESSLLKPAV